MALCYQLLGRYNDAEKTAREGLKLFPDYLFIEKDLAAVLLFRDKFTEVEKIYRQYKDELKKNFLNDLKQFAEVGVIPKEREADVEKIKQILEE